jgi:hypothetical protein
MATGIGDASADGLLFWDPSAKVTDGLLWPIISRMGHATETRARAAGKPEHTFTATSARYVRIQPLKPDGPNQKGNQMAVVELEVYQDLLGGEGAKEMGKK